MEALEGGTEGRDTLREGSGEPEVLDSPDLFEFCEKVGKLCCVGVGEIVAEESNEHTICWF